MPPRLRKLLLIQEGGLMLVVLVLGIIFTVFGGSASYPVYEPGPDGQSQRVFTTGADGARIPLMVSKNKFLNAQNLSQLAKDTSFVAIMAIGMSVVIISGGIDLSVGAIYALAAVLGALVLQHFGPGGPLFGSDAKLLPGLSPSLPLWGTALGALTCVGVAVLCGLINGSLLVALRVHPFIITLGTMAIFRGVAFVITKGQSIGGFPPQWRELIRYQLSGNLSVVPMAVMVLVTMVGGLFLSRLAAGRRVYAIGGNELAARFSGIRVEGVKLGVYIISGLTAGIAALLALGYYGSGSSGDGEGYELNVIAAAVVGGASLTGGRGSALGALLGALVIQMISSGIIILGIDQNYSKIIIGSVVIAAVVLDKFNTWLTQRHLTRASS